MISFTNCTMIQVIISMLAWTSSTVTAFQFSNVWSHCGHNNIIHRGSRDASSSIASSSIIHRSTTTSINLIPSRTNRFTSKSHPFNYHQYSPFCSSTTTRTISTTSSTSLQANDVLSNINNFYQTAPFTAAFITCGIKASAADLLAQTRTMKQKENEQEDSIGATPTTNRNTFYGERHVRGTELEQEPSKNFMNAFLSVFTNNNSSSSSNSNSNSNSSSNKPTAVGDNRDQIDTTISAAGTTTTNTALSGDNDTNSLEYQRNIAFILYGGLYQGMAQEYLYNYLFPVWFGVGNDLTTVLTKVVFDLVVVSPLVCIPIAYLVKAIIYRKDLWIDGIGKYVYDLRHKNLLLTYYSIWFPAGMCSFGLVPDHLRIAFIAFISFFWLIILSTISSSSKEGEESNAISRTEYSS